MWLFVNNTVLCVGIERSRVWRLLDDVAVFLRVKSAMKSTMPFVDRGDIEKVQLRGADTWSWGEGCVCVCVWRFLRRQGFVLVYRLGLLHMCLDVRILNRAIQCSTNSSRWNLTFVQSSLFQAAWSIEKKRQTHIRT